MVESTPSSNKTISQNTSDEDLVALMASAKQHNDKDLWWKCLRRRYGLKRQEVSEKNSPMEQEFYAVMFAYEAIEAELHHRNKYRAVRTWKEFENKGVRATLEKWAKNKQKGPVFNTLIDHDAYDLTGEYLVLKHETEFSTEAVASARQSLVKAGVPIEKLQASL